MTKQAIAEAYKRYRGKPDVPAFSVLRRLLIEQLSKREREVYELLVEMGQEEEIGLSASELAYSLEIATPNAWQLLDRLVKLGLVERHQAKDKRKFRYYLVDFNQVEVR
jgi:predicted transcriptional regulator